MAITDVTSALAQYNANPPSTWSDPAAAAACLDAVYWLLGNRAKVLADQGTTVNFEGFEGIRATLETRLGTKAPRANGRSRRVGAAFANDGGIQ